MQENLSYPSFAPELFISNGIRDISFYERGLGAVETLRFNNEDGSVHVAAFNINGAVFHVHEITASPEMFEPLKHNGCTVRIGLFVEDVDALINKAVAAGAVQARKVSARLDRRTAPWRGRHGLP